MSKSTESSAAGGIGFVGMLTIAFIVLRLCNVITWSWWWVLAPLWMPLTVCAGVFVVALVVYMAWAAIK